MLAKIWKKVGLIILIVACLWNLIFKFMNKVSFKSLIDNAKSVIYQTK